MAHDDHVRRKARELRRSRRLTIDEIAECLSVSRSTVYSWIRGLPPSEREGRGGHAANQAMQLKFRRLREDAYAAGAAEFDGLCSDRTFRDFVCMYLGEGTKRDRNMVAICNSDPAIVRMAHSWIAHFSARKISYGLQYHRDQHAGELVDFWASVLDVSSDLIVAQRKSNSGQLKGRSWRSRHGVLMVRTCDTYLRARIQAWMDRLRAEWETSAAASGVRAAG